MNKDRETESRTLLLDTQLIDDLSSPVDEVRTKAIEELPEGLSRKEVRDVAYQVFLSADANDISRGRAMELDALFHIASTALYHRQDLITAENASKELRRKGVKGIMGYLLVRRALKKVKGQIVESIIDTDK